MWDRIKTALTFERRDDGARIVSSRHGMFRAVFSGEFVHFLIEFRTFYIGWDK